jgi:YegS/Rv2252/BmrU family lipid kinase
MTQPAEFVIIYNPTAGRSRSARTAQSVASELRKLDIRAEARPTSAPGDAEKIAEEAIAKHSGKSPLCVVACGGDGTVQDVANAVARSRAHANSSESEKNPTAVMGVAPTGRCNDFARALSIPPSTQGIVRTLVEGTNSDIDLGRIGDRYFCTIAAIGFDAAVSRYVNEMWIPLRGAPAYVYGTLQTLIRYRTPQMRLRGDFDDYEGPVFFAACANTSFYGGAMRIAPSADPNDGKLDICLVRKISRLRTLSLLPSVMTGTHTGRQEVQMLRTTRLDLEPLDESTVEIWADGEPMTTAPATVWCVPAAVVVRKPPGISGIISREA